jgi:hypothetical protein
MRERSLNVYENKGALWKTPERSFNVIGNKGIYPTEAGMLLKSQGVSSQDKIEIGADQGQFVIFAPRRLISPDPKTRVVKSSIDLETGRARNAKSSFT